MTLDTIGGDLELILELVLELVLELPLELPLELMLDERLDERLDVHEHGQAVDQQWTRSVYDACAYVRHGHCSRARMRTRMRTRT